MRKVRRKRKVQRRNVLSVSMPAKKSNGQLQRMGWMLGLGIFSCAVVGYTAHIAFKSFVTQAFYQNADFSVQNIEVRTGGTMSPSQVLRWAGVEKGQNLIAIDLDQVRTALLRNPYIERVNVVRKLPDTLQITIEERQPVALLQPASKRGYSLAQEIYYIDAHGVVMKPKAGDRLKQLPVITGVEADYIVEGARIQHVEVLSALNFIRLAELSLVKMDLDLTQIDVSRSGFLRTRTRDRGFIQFRVDCLDQQLRRLRVIFDYAKGREMFVRTVDLSPERNVPVTFF